MDAATRDFVRRRASECCEYCRLRQKDSELTHHVEHIVAKQHGGSDDPNNLALACHRCNLHKGPNLTGIDPQTGQTAPLLRDRARHSPRVSHERCPPPRSQAGGSEAPRPALIWIDSNGTSPHSSIA